MSSTYFVHVPAELTNPDRSFKYSDQPVMFSSLFVFVMPYCIIQAPHFLTPTTQHSAAMPPSSLSTCKPTYLSLHHVFRPKQCISKRSPGRNNIHSSSLLLPLSSLALGGAARTVTKYPLILCEVSIISIAIHASCSSARRPSRNARMAHYFPRPRAGASARLIGP
jgi:hypothetical protein